MDAEMEGIFTAWATYDSELDPTKKEEIEGVLNSRIDEFQKKHDTHMARFLFKFYSRDAYAKWKTQNEQ